MKRLPCLLVLAWLLMALPPLLFAAEEFRLAHPRKEHLTARQLYELGYPAKAIDEVVGRFVLLNVVVRIAREVPLVDIEMPEELAARKDPPYHTLPAHLVNAASHISSTKVGERLQIEGIIVQEGYGAYFIYLRKVRILK